MIHPKCKKFVKGMKIKATGESKLNDSSVQGLKKFQLAITTSSSQILLALGKSLFPFLMI